MCQKASGSIERTVIADAGEYVEDLPLFWLDVLRSLRRLGSPKHQWRKSLFLIPRQSLHWLIFVTILLG